MKIRPTDKKRIEKVLEKIENKCKARLFSDFDLEGAIEKAEKQLESFSIPKKYWVDSIIYCSPEKVANAYSGIAEGTYCVLKKFPTGWFITSIFRRASGKCAYGSYAEYELTLSELAKKNIPSIDL